MNVLAGRTPTIPRAAAARRRLRRGRAVPLSLTQHLAIWFERLLYTGVIGGVVVEAASGALAGAAAVDPASTDAARSLTGLAVGILLVALLLKGGIAFGPLFAGANVVTWLLSSPIDRGAALAGRGLAVLAVGAAAGPVVVLVTGAVAGSTQLAGSAVTGGLGGALGGVLLAAGLVLVQSAPDGVQRAARRAVDAVAVGTVGGWTVLMALPASTLDPIAPVALLATPEVPLVTGVSAAACVAVAALRLGRIDRRVLLRGADVAVVSAVSVTFLDLTPLSAMLLDRRARVLGRVRSARLAGSRRMALLRADMVRCTRTWAPALSWIGLTLLPALVRDTGLGGAVGAVHACAAFVVADRFARGLKLVCRSPAIRRALGGTDRELRLVHLAVPLAATSTWSALAGAIAGLPVPAIALSAVGAVGAVYRMATRPPLDYAAATYDVGLFGPAPVGLIVQLARGPALLALVVVVQLTLFA